MTSALKPQELQALKKLYQLGKDLEASYVAPQSASSDQPAFDIRRLEFFIEDLAALSRFENPDLARFCRIPEHLHPEMTLGHFLNFLLPLERLLDRALRDDEFLITTNDSSPEQILENRVPLVLVLDNLRSAFNVGSIFRMAETLLVEEIHLIGYTPGPESQQVQKTSMGTIDQTPTRRFVAVEESLECLHQKGYRTVAFETATRAKDLYDGTLPPKAAFVFGNERFGLGRGTLSLCQEVRQIPLRGRKNSLNVASSIAICSFEWNRQTQIASSRQKDK